VLAPGALLVLVHSLSIRTAFSSAAAAWPAPCTTCASCVSLILLSGNSCRCLCLFPHRSDSQASEADEPFTMVTKRGHHPNNDCAL